MKNAKKLIMIFGFLLISSLAIFAFQTRIGADSPAIVAGENPPQRPTYNYCGTHTCDDGTQVPYYNTSCPPGVNYCVRQSCEEALYVVSFFHCM